MKTRVLNVNKSHAVCYSVLTLQTAFCRVHYPVYFFKALLNLNKDKIGKVNKYIIEAKKANVSILPPNINKSDMNFSVVDNQVLYGLSAISGIGNTLAETIITERNVNGKFLNFKDFVNRVQPTKAQIISLVKSGAIPSKNKRNFLINYFKSIYTVKEYTPAKTYGTKAKLLEEWGINADDYMIGKKVDKDAVLALYNAVRKKKYDKEQQDKYKAYIAECEEKYLQDEDMWEFQTLETFISSKNPFEQAYDYLPDFDEVQQGEKCTIVGVISSIQKKKCKNGNQFAFVRLYSGTGSLVEVTVWPDALKKFQDLIVKGSQVAILCKKESSENVICDRMKSYNQWLSDIKHTYRIP